MWLSGLSIWLVTTVAWVTSSIPGPGTTSAARKKKAKLKTKLN